MATIRMTVEGKEYKLGFDRDSVKRMANKGFSFTKYMDAPIERATELFDGAFYINDITVPQEVKDAIWESVEDKETLCEKLIELYADVINKTFAAPGANAKKVTWEVAD